MALRYGITQALLRDYTRLSASLMATTRTTATSSTNKAEAAAAAVPVPAAPVKKSIFDSWGEPGDFGSLPVKPMPKDYKENPERDIENFPHYEHTKFPKAQLRFNVIPDSWFQAFYDKTGVTGPYLFFAGGFNFLVSKEWFLMDPHFNVCLDIAIILYLGHKLFGGKIQNRVTFLAERTLKREQEWRDGAENGLRNTIQQEEQHQAALKETLPLFTEAQKEYANLQQEEEYRRRVHQVHGDVKRRLDYMVESEATKKRFEHRHMVNWIVDEVKKSVTPEKEKAFLNQCVADLQSLSKTARV